MAKDRWKCAIPLLTGMRKTLEYGQAQQENMAAQGIPVNARSYAIKQPVSQVFLKITSFQLSTANSLQMIEN